MGVTYDTGALVAADRGERRMWARHRALLARREVPTTPAPVVAQTWRGGGRRKLLPPRRVGRLAQRRPVDHQLAVGVRRRPLRVYATACSPVFLVESGCVLVE